MDRLPGNWGTKMKDKVVQHYSAPVEAQIKAEVANAERTGNYSRVNWYAQRYPQVYAQAKTQATDTAKKWGYGLAAGGVGLAALLPFLWNNDDEDEPQQAQTPDPRRMASYRLS
jgi:hypothetical protein